MLALILRVGLPMWFASTVAAQSPTIYRPPRIPITLALVEQLPVPGARAVVLTNRGSHGNVILLRESTAKGEDVATALKALLIARDATPEAKGHLRIVVPSTARPDLAPAEVAAAQKWVARARTQALQPQAFGTARTVYLLVGNPQSGRRTHPRRPTRRWRCRIAGLSAGDRLARIRRPGCERPGARCVMERTGI